MTTDDNAQGTLRRLIIGHWVSQAIRVAAELGIADLLAEGARTSHDLARASGVDSRSLYRLLRALTAVGVVREIDESSFELTSMGLCLRSSVPGSLRAYAMVFAGDRHWQAWADLAHSVRTGETGYEHHFGVRFYDDLAQDPDAAELFTQAMTGSAAVATAAVVEAYDFSGIGTLVDVGGGDATMLAAILWGNPAMRGVLFEQAAVAERAKNHIAEAGLASRCQVVTGDFFAAVPSGADAYLLARCLRAFDDARSIQILTTARRAMTAEARLLLAERMIVPGDEGADARLGDLNMLVLTGGCERSQSEYTRLLHAAGFQLLRVVATRSATTVLEARPA